MDIAILNYPTGEVDILRNVDDDMIHNKFEDNVELYLDSIGYRVNDIYWMANDYNIVVNDSLYE